MSWIGLALATLALGPLQDKRESTVGMPARVEQVMMPGSELEAIPAELKSPIVLRITATWPHGTAFRYDLEYTGLEAGDFDLRDFLRRKDASSTSDLPPIPVTIRSVLPAGQVRPHPPAKGEVPWFGGYGTFLVVSGVLWVAGLLALLFVGRRKKEHDVETLARPRTLAERLRPLVERALAGSLSRSERAQLELGLVAYWRRRLGLEEKPPAHVIEMLRDHPEAGPLLRSLEEWLHAPSPPAAVDIPALLAPYRDLPADALDAS
jgi:hypothetical protein